MTRTLPTATAAALLLAAAVYVTRPTAAPPSKYLFCPHACSAESYDEARRYIGRIWRTTLDACACEAP